MMNQHLLIVILPRLWRKLGLSQCSRLLSDLGIVIASASIGGFSGLFKNFATSLTYPLYWLFMQISSMSRVLSAAASFSGVSLEMSTWSALLLSLTMPFCSVSEISSGELTGSGLLAFFPGMPTPFRRRFLIPLYIKKTREIGQNVNKCRLFTNYRTMAIRSFMESLAWSILPFGIRGTSLSSSASRTSSSVANLASLSSALLESSSLDFSLWILTKALIFSRTGA